MSERAYRALFEHAPIALWDVDVRQVASVCSAIAGAAGPADAAAWASHLAANPGAVRALAAAVIVRDGNQRARALDAAAPDAAALLGRVPAASAARLLAAVICGQPFAEETTWRAGGTAVRVRLTCSLLEGADGGRGLIGVVELAGPAPDATPAVTPGAAAATEPAAPAAPVSVPRELEDLERALASARDELAHFAYVASHDLQAPLRLVVGYLDLLQHRYGDALDERARKYIEQAGQGARHMRALIDGLLALSRVLTRPGARVAVQVSELLAEAEVRLRRRIAESGARITHDALPTLTADRGQLGQVLEHLLDNAIKFRGADAPAIHVGAQRERDAWLLSVTDNGIGMDPARLTAIFRPFQRLHPPRTYPGIGLGLAIVARIVERHGGRVWATSQPGQGAAFHVLWPDSRPDTEPPPTSPPASAGDAPG